MRLKRGADVLDGLGRCLHADEVCSGGSGEGEGEGVPR